MEGVDGYPQRAYSPAKYCNFSINRFPYFNPFHFEKNIFFGMQVFTATEVMFSNFEFL